jgi:transcriptional regulator with GAF, ATPase, and Fis domain
MQNSPDLSAGLERLACLVGLAEPMDEVLGRVAQYALTAIRDCDAVSIATLAGGRPVLVAATDPRARAADVAQWELAEGPALSTVSHGRVTAAGALRRELDWPRWATEVVDSGLYSVLCAPLVAAQTLIGTLTVFNQRERVYDPESVMHIQRFARPAAVVIYNLQLIQQLQAQLTRATDMSNQAASAAVAASAGSSTWT